MTTWNFTAGARNKRDLTGQVFGALTVLAEAPSLGHGARWRCRCECGGFSIQRTTDLKRRVGRPAKHDGCRKETG